MSNSDSGTPSGGRKSEYEIKMGVIDDGGCLVPMLAVLVIAALSIGLSFWLAR